MLQICNTISYIVQTTMTRRTRTKKCFETDRYLSSCISHKLIQAHSSLKHRDLRRMKLQELTYAIKGHGICMKTNMFCVRVYEENRVIFADRASTDQTDQLQSYKFAPWHEVSVESPCVRKAFARDTPILILKDDVLDSVRDEVEQLQQRIDHVLIIRSPPARMRHAPAAADVDATQQLRLDQIQESQTLLLGCGTST